MLPRIRFLFCLFSHEKMKYLISGVFALLLPYFFTYRGYLITHTEKSTSYFLIGSINITLHILKEYINSLTLFLCIYKHDIYSSPVNALAIQVIVKKPRNSGQTPDFHRRSRSEYIAIGPNAFKSWMYHREQLPHWLISPSSWSAALTEDPVLKRLWH